MTERLSVTTRLKRLAAFVAIVWGIAATFVAFDIVSMFAFDLISASPLFGRFVAGDLSSSTSCRIEPDLASQHRDVPTPAGDDGAFMLGVLVGRLAAFGPFAASNPAALAPLVAAMREAALRSEVAAPAPFVPRQLANAYTEFVTWIEADDDRTARHIAARYSPRACHAYKLGAVWGYREVVRLSVPTDSSAFGVQIRYYAAQIPIPEELWRAMLEPSAEPAGSDQLEAEGNAVTAAVLSFLRQ